MINRIIHGCLANRPAVLVYEADIVRGYVHTGVTWREIPSEVIVERGVILDPRMYARRWPGLKLPLFDVAA
jgi:hypothetical protein